MDVVARRKLLGRLFARLDAVERRRDPTEPPQELTIAYATLLFACGHAHLGNPKRALALADEARTLIGSDLDDLVHGWLFRAFAYRVRGLDLPEPLLAELADVGRVERYKIDRLREASRLLSDQPVDAIRQFTSRGRDRTRSRERTTAAVLRLEIEGLLARRQETLDDLVRDATSYASGDCEPEIARDAIERVLPWIGRVSSVDRSLRCALAMQTAAAVAPERVQPLADVLVASLEAIDEADLTKLMAALVPALVPSHAHTLADVWRALPAAAHGTVVHRAGELRLGRAPTIDDVRAVATAEAGDGDDRHLHGDALHAAVLDAYLARPLAERFTGTWLEDLFAVTTDSYSTNSHYSFRVVRFVDRVVHGACT